MRDNAAPERRGYIRIDLGALRAGRDIDFDLFIEEGDELVLYRAASLPFEASDMQRLVAGGVQALWVFEQFEPRVGRYFERHLGEILADDSVPTAAKARTGLFAAALLAVDILEEPSDANVRRSTRVIYALASFATTNPLAIRQLIRATAGRSCLHWHSANTAVYALAIAHRSRMRNLERVGELAIAAYLHDIGMSQIPTRVLNKPGALDPQEWKLIQQHPETGERILAQTGAFSDNVMTAVRMHHERLDGQGYPDGAQGAEIPWEARVTAVAEVFDALTSERPYGQPIRSFEAIQLMMEGEAGALDADVIRQLIPALSAELPGADPEDG